MKTKGKRYSEAQMIYALRQIEGGRRIAEICRELGVTEQTYHRDSTELAEVWKRQYAGMGVTELQELRKLREENNSLRKLVADLSLDKHILQEVVSKKLGGLPTRRIRQEGLRCL